MSDSISPENYIVIQGWMITELNLSGKELLLYALIFGFSQGDGDGYSGGLKYLTEWTGTTKRNVMTLLTSLVSKGHLTKHEETKGGVKFCRYVANFTSSEKISLPPGEKFSLGGEKISPNNNINNTILTDRKSVCNTSYKPQFETEFEDLWNKYPKKQGKQNALKAFIKARESGIPLEVIDNGLDQYLFYIQKTGTDTRYIKNGSTWFNQHCWDDDYTVVEREQQDARYMTKGEQAAKDLHDSLDLISEWVRERSENDN